MERLSENGDDKMLLLKLQNEVNFLRKKQEEAFETLILKEKELEEAKLAAKEAQRKEHLRDENSQKLLEEINLWQVKDTVAMYESRIADLNVMNLLYNISIKHN
jgi:hypothetical protein